MENNVKVRAVFQGCNIKTGKTVMQFELDPEHQGALPQLAMMTGTFVTLELTSDQLVIPVDMGSGEEIAIQTSRQVLNPKSRGNVAELRTLMARGANPYPGCEHCTNDHLRAAACHGAYYLARRLRRR